MASSNTIATAFLFLMCFGLPASFASANTFDFYYLVLQWPGAYCAQSACCRPTTGAPKDDFFIRGLWPVDGATGKAITKCSSTSFYVDQLVGLVDELHAYWSNIKCPSNDGVAYWKSAWKTYGICSDMNETEYFSAGLELRAKADVLSALSRKGISPSLLYIYGLSEVKDAIAEKIGAMPVIKCSKGLIGMSQLYEVYICVDKDAKTIINCPVEPSFTCGDEIHFNPFDANSLRDDLTAANPIKMPVSVE